jgi:predicted metal-dependent phosphoesterase TrpH
MGLYDLHLHTLYSTHSIHPGSWIEKTISFLSGEPLKSNYLIDSFITPKDMERMFKKRGLDGAAITDHNTLEGAYRYKRYLDRKGFLIIQGEELYTKYGDIIVLGINEEIEPSLSFLEICDKVKGQDGIMFPPHPYFHFLESPHPLLIQFLKSLRITKLPPYGKGVGEKFIRENKKKFDAIEVFNGEIPYNLNQRAKCLAEELKMPEVAGSDSHTPDGIGRCVTEVFCEKDEDAIVQNIRKGRTRTYGEKRSTFQVLGDLREKSRYLMAYHAWKAYRHELEQET